MSSSDLTQFLDSNKNDAKFEASTETRPDEASSSRPATLHVTGDPFVDNGSWLATALAEKSDPREVDVKILREKVLPLIPSLFFLDEKVLQVLFTTNHPAIHPSLKKDKDIQRLVLENMLNDLLKEFPTETKGQFHCVVCDIRTDIPKIRRNQPKEGKDPKKKNALGNRELVPMSGSQTLANFFPSGMEGLIYCARCLFAVQLCFGTVWKRQGYLILLHSPSHLVMLNLARYHADRLKRLQALSALADEQFKADDIKQVSRSVNAIFRIVENFVTYLRTRVSIEDQHQIVANGNLIFYEFTNYGQNPDVKEVYQFPNPVFEFYMHIVAMNYFSKWLEIVRRGFIQKKRKTKKKEKKGKGKKSSAFEEKNTRRPKRAKNNEDAENEVDWDATFTTQRNVVYERLLKNQTIVSYFLNHRKRKSFADWKLLKTYLEVVRKMEDKRIEVYKRVGDSIADYIKKTNSDKRLKQLERATSFDTFRLVLLRIFKEYLQLSPQHEPLFTIEEYFNDLFPEGHYSWKETRDILLFRIYEVLGSWLIDHDFLPLDEEEEEESELTIAETP